MIKNKLIKWTGILIAAGLLPLSAMAQDKGGDNWSISGWINEALIYYDDGDKSDVVQASDNGTTLGSRITLAGSTELENGGLDAGFEVILEPLSTRTPLIFSNQDNFDDNNGADIGVLGTSGYVGGAFGKLTVGLQTMPTDNIAVLADPSLTLWSAISPVFRGNGFFLEGANISTPTATTRSGARWGDFLNCYTADGLRGAGGIGIDCNGIYRNGIRYDLPTFHEDLSIAVSYANDDVFDIALKYKADIGTMKFLLYAGYAENHGVNPVSTTWLLQPNHVGSGTGNNRFSTRNDFMFSLHELDEDDIILGALNDARSGTDYTAIDQTDGPERADRVSAADAYDSIDDTGADGDTARDEIFAGVARTAGGSLLTSPSNTHYDEADNLQIQLGLMHPVTGIFGTLAYQDESADLDDVNLPGELDNSDAWWLKIGIKKAFTSVGDTALTFQYGEYNDQYGIAHHAVGVTGSEVQRVGFSVDQYFGSRLIIYGAYENLDLDIDGGALAERLYGDVDELELFTAGMTFFF